MLYLYWELGIHNTARVWCHSYYAQATRKQLEETSFLNQRVSLFEFHCMNCRKHDRRLLAPYIGFREESTIIGETNVHRTPSQVTILIVARLDPTMFFMSYMEHMSRNTITHCSSTLSYVLWAFHWLRQGNSWCVILMWWWWYGCLQVIVASHV